jgi:hypothetical protein
MIMVHDYISPDTPIDELEASVRLAHCLEAECVKLRGKPTVSDFVERGSLVKEPELRPAVADFLDRTDEEWLALPNFGKKTLAEWHEIVERTKLEPPTEAERLLHELEKARFDYRMACITRHFNWRDVMIWYDNVVAGRRMKDIAPDYGVSAQRVSQIVRTFRAKLARRTKRVQAASIKLNTAEHAYYYREREDA